MKQGWRIGNNMLYADLVRVVEDMDTPSQHVHTADFGLCHKGLETIILAGAYVWRMR